MSTLRKRLKIKFLERYLSSHYLTFIGFSSNHPKRISPKRNTTIASASVMKNIAETKAHDIAKSEKEKERKYVFALTTMQAIHSTISSLREYQSPEPVSILHLNFMANMETVQKLIDSIFSESILTHLPENEKNDISEFYISFNRYLFFKKLSSPNQNSPTDVNGFNDVIKQYKEQFGKYSKNYIEIYNINKDSQ